MSDLNPESPPPVLLVDDEPEILHSLKGLLRRQFTLYTAESGDQALEILRENPVHVIMTDQRMPEMTGAELLRQTRQLNPNTIRIIFTGYADIKAVVDAVNQGQLFRYITKPWDPDELLETLSQATCEYARRQRNRKLLTDVADLLDETLGDSSLRGELHQRAQSLLAEIRESVTASNDSV